MDLLGYERQNSHFVDELMAAGHKLPVTLSFFFIDSSYISLRFNEPLKF